MGKICDVVAKWKPSASAGVTGQKVRSSTQIGDTAAATVETDLAADQASWTVEAVAPGTVVSVGVAAVNEMGASDYASGSIVVPANLEKPLAPSDVTFEVVNVRDDAPPAPPAETPPEPAPAEPAPVEAPPAEAPAEAPPAEAPPA